jgi:GrpB-like predicted nucleotidyltransferase (UPF0157 family)
MLAIWKFELSDYDPSWPARYRAEISELERLLPMVLASEHVGSTSIHPMAAVSTIDILAGVGKLNEVTDAVSGAPSRYAEPAMPDGYIGRVDHGKRQFAIIRRSGRETT